MHTSELPCIGESYYRLWRGFSVLRVSCSVYAMAVNLVRHESPCWRHQENNHHGVLARLTVLIHLALGPLPAVPVACHPGLPFLTRPSSPLLRHVFDSRHPVDLWGYWDRCVNGGDCN